MNKETIVLGGGCFWCLDAVFSRVRGVNLVEVGYAGGDELNPSYEEVSSGNTGHVETVRIIYDPSVIKLEDILSIFFLIHDPTSLNRQGNDIGPQYRSAIFYKNNDERVAVGFFITQISDSYKNPIVTEVVELRAFYPAESYHDNYFKKHPQNPYCQLVIAPKIEKLKKTFEKFYKPE